MRAAQIYGRLIWKETRESLLMMSVGFVAPAAVLVMIEKKMFAHQWMFVVLLMATVMGTFLWAAEKANAKRSRNDFEDTYLVLPKAADWLTSYAFPALIAFAIGAWLGFVLDAAPGWSQTHWSHTRQWTMLTSGLCMLSGFLVCYATSRAFGFSFGAIVGAVWLIFPTTPLAVPASSQTVGDESPVFAAFMIRAMIGAVVGSLLVLAASRARSRPRFQVVPLILAAAACCGPHLGVLLASLRGIEGIEPSYINYAILSNSSPDGSLAIGPTGTRSGMSASLRLANCRDGVSWERSFHQAVQPLGLTDRVAYLAQQGIGEDHVRIFAWDIATGKVRCRARIRVGKNAILGCQPGAVSPDGRFLILCLGATIGQGHDLWALDMANGRHRLLAPNTRSECRQAQWMGNRAILSGNGKAMRVRLADLSGHGVSIAVPSEVQR
ncbi:MAG: hypothetical protein M1133_14340 [Armatimonadetes bacterium]|nr:hypothetical protein [Armatimonadota bacterium]